MNQLKMNNCFMFYVLAECLNVKITISQILKAGLKGGHWNFCGQSKKQRKGEKKLQNNSDLDRSIHKL